jgi:hypothetical protein
VSRVLFLPHNIQLSEPSQNADSIIRMKINVQLFVKCERFENTRSAEDAIVSSEIKCCAMVQAVSSRLLTAEANATALVSPCGICGGQNGTGTGFSPSSSANIMPSGL